MEEYLKEIDIFNFTKSGLSLNSINDNVINLYNRNGNKNQDKVDENTSYILKQNKLHIKYKNIIYEIEKVPYIFYKEKE